mmetsp:Transcript_13816/g.30009  ORF Transcript_13816/g.30009 Transcript_13816/m.30009 type:complete len:340 (-) Transcript_13816:370-1389(-)
MIQYEGGSGVSVLRDFPQQRNGVGVFDPPLLGQPPFVPRAEDANFLLFSVQLFVSFQHVVLDDFYEFIGHSRSLRQVPNDPVLSQRLQKLFPEQRFIDLHIVLVLFLLEIGHVFHHRDAGHVDRVEHLHPPFHVDEAQFLRSRHDDGRGDAQPLAQRQLYVPRPGRHVHDEVINRPPIGERQKLIQQLRDHGAAHHRRSLVDVPEAHEPHAPPSKWGDLPPHEPDVVVLGRHHRGQARAVHIRVEDSHPRPQALEGEREVHGRRGLSHAALARRHGDDRADLGHAQGGARGGLGRTGRQGDVGAARPFESVDGVLTLLHEEVLDGTRGRGELEVERDHA